MGDFKHIMMPTKKINTDILTKYQVIGKGVHGTVFKISIEKCIKVFTNEEMTKKEAEVYKRTRGSKIMPQCYEIGKNYIVMEYVKGMPLDKYLLKKGYMQPKITLQLIELIKEMKRLRFTRLNPSIRHIYVTKDKSLKLIDHVGSYSREELVPLKLLIWMQNNRLLSSFLNQVKLIDNDLSMKWAECLTAYLQNNKPPVNKKSTHKKLYGTPKHRQH